MVRRWGFDTRAEDAAMDGFAARLRVRLRRGDDAKAVVREFMASYLRVGGDPTETVRRDNAWTFLLGATKRLLSEQELDALWNERPGWGCAIN